MSDAMRDTAAWGLLGAAEGPMHRLVEGNLVGPLAPRPEPVAVGYTVGFEISYASYFKDDLPPFTVHDEFRFRSGVVRGALPAPVFTRGVRMYSGGP